MEEHTLPTRKYGYKKIFVFLLLCAILPCVYFVILRGANFDLHPKYLLHMMMMSTPPNVTKGQHFMYLNITENVTSTPLSFTKDALSTTPSAVNPHNFHYIILENETCVSTETTEVYLMILVCVAPANFEHRNVIRNTWGSIVKKDKSVRLLFILGQTLHEDTQSKIINESTQYHDIVQESFIDSYQNLSLKSVALLKWSRTYCKTVKYILKVDDDMFINVPYLIGVLKDRKITNGIIGMRQDGARPIRDQTSKWYTSLKMYNASSYPAYTSGTSYVISGDIASELYEASLAVPFFWLEDVYVTGLCRRHINANVVNDYGFSYAHRAVTGCAYRHIISGHKNTPAEITKIWQELQDPNLKC